MKPTGKSLVMGGIVAFGLVLGLGSAMILHADEGDSGGQSGRAARLSTVDGQVQVAQGGQMLADHAVANTPLFEGTELTTGNDGRAEVQFDDGSVARIAPDSSLTISVLRSNGDTELVLNGGMGYFELQGGSQGSPMRVQFGAGMLTASGFTVIRLKLDEGPANVAVFSGNAHLEGTGLAVDLHGGESIAVNGGNPADSSVAESIEPDSWDAWNSDRDQALTASETASTPIDQNLPQANNPAWGDLNSSGTWYEVPNQGAIWSPYEASNPGWDPYGTGYWMMTPRYGYVWVSGEPWGYMPYQCGAWNYYDAFGWGWAPGMCQTWWGGGYGGGYGGGGYGDGGYGGGWYYTIGATPKWYKLPQRPIAPRPRSPHHGGVYEVGSAPVIPVTRKFPLAGGAPLPPRAVGTPVMIGGTVASPMRPVASRPVASRPVYGRPAPPDSRTVRDQPSQNTMRPAYPRAPQTAPQPGGERGNWPSARPPSQPYSPPASRPVENPRPAPSAPRPEPSAPRPSEGSRNQFGGGAGRSAPAPPPSRPPSPPPASAPSHSSSPAPAPGHPK